LIAATLCVERRAVSRMSEKNIICQDHRCVVVIRRGGRSYTKSVAYSRAGGPQGALRKARAWRDQKLAELPPPGRRAGPRRRPLANKQSAQPAGVSEHVSRDGRLRFSVNWKDESGRKRVKVFSAGPAAT